MGSRRDRRLDNIKSEAPPGLTFLFESHAVLEEPLELGPLPNGRRLLIPIAAGGSIEGPRMRGQYLPGSTLLQLVRSDGVVEVEGRIFIEMDDGHRVFSCLIGILSMSAEDAEDLAKGLPYDPTALYVRTSALFEAADDGPYAWLNRGLYVSRSMRTPHAAHSTTWEIL